MKRRRGSKINRRPTHHSSELPWASAELKPWTASASLFVGQGWFSLMAGIIGNAILSNRTVGYFPRRRTMIL